MTKFYLENSKLKNGHNFVQKNGGLPPLLVWVPLLILNNYSEFQVNIFSNKRDIRKCQSFHTPPPTPGQYLDVFFENSQANMKCHRTEEITSMLFSNNLRFESTLSGGCKIPHNFCVVGYNCGSM